MLCIHAKAPARMSEKGNSAGIIVKEVVKINEICAAKCKSAWKEYFVFLTCHLSPIQKDDRAIFFLYLSECNFHTNHT